MAVVAVVEATARQLRTPKPECGDCPACASLGSMKEVACLPPPSLPRHLSLDAAVGLSGWAGRHAGKPGFNIFPLTSAHSSPPSLFHQLLCTLSRLILFLSM